MAFDLRQYLSDLAAKGELSAEDITLLEGKLNKPGAIKFLEESQLRQSDYDRKMNTLKAEHDTAMKGVTTLQQELVGWRKEAQARIDKATEDLRTRDTTIAQYEASMRKIASDYGLDATDLLKPAEPPAHTPPAPPPGVPVISEEFKAFRQDFDTARKVMPLLPAQIYDLAVEHRALFGKDLTNTSELVSKAMETGKPIREVWEQDYKVADRRTEVQQQAKIEEEARIRSDERQKVLSEHALPSLRPDAPRSTLLTTLPQHRPGEQKTGELNDVDKAVLAFETGKYRTGAA